MSLSEQNRAIPTPDNFRLFGFATGSYMCHCHTCKVEFEGDKRAITCLPCALTRAETAVRQDGSAGDAGAAMRHTLSVQETDKSARAEGVAALQQAGESVEACIADIKAGLCCPRVHGCEQNDSEYCHVRQAFARAGLIPDPDASPLPQQTALVGGKD